jgi:L-malate glycosyltransferase
MPKVLHIVYNLTRGGTEGQCARVALEMARRGELHRVAAFRREGFFLEAVEQAAGEVYEVRIRKLVSLRTLGEISRLHWFIRREGVELVHAWDADAAIFGSVAARWARIPYITSRRDLGEIYPRWKLRLMRRADRGSEVVVVNAEVIRDQVRAAGIKTTRIRKIHNIVDLDEFDRLQADPFSLRGRLPEGRLVGLVARLDPEKDVKTFVNAAAQVAARRADVGFVVAGDGPERAGLESLARDLGLREDRMVFLGDVSDVPALVARLSVGVLVPRANEGLSNSILEYMCGRVPVVATRCGGNAELVQDGQTGFVRPPGDVSGIAGAIGRLLDDPALAASFGRKGRAQVERNHRPVSIARQFAELYEAITRGSRTTISGEAS